MTKKEEKQCRQQQRLPSNPIFERRAFHIQLDILDEDKQERDPNWIVKEVCGHCEYKGDLYVKVKWMNDNDSWFHVNQVRCHCLHKLLNYIQEHKLWAFSQLKWISEVFEGMSDLDERKKSLINSCEYIFNKVNKVLTIQDDEDGNKVKFGVKVPKTVKEAYELDKKNGNILWVKAIQKELDQIMDFDTFHVLPDKVYLPGYYK